MKSNTDNSESLTNMNRRRFLTGTAATGTVAAVGTVPRFSPIGQARALAPVALGVGYAVGIGAAYAARRVDSFLTGDDFDEDGFDAAVAEEAYASIRSQGIEMYAVDDSTLTNLSNVLETAENGAYTDGQSAAVEAMELGEDESAVIAAAEEAVDNFYATQQKNLIDHYRIQINKLFRMGMVVIDNPDLEHSTLFTRVSESDSEPGLALSEANVTTQTMLDGTDMSFKTATSRSEFLTPTGETHTTSVADETNISYVRLNAAYDESESVKIFDSLVYYDLWTTIVGQHTDVVADITEWVQSVYPGYEKGDINLADLVTSSQFSSTAAEETGYAFSTADLALMGIPISEGTMLINLPNANDGEGATVEGALAARSPPEGGFEVGVEYDPAGVPGPVWLAYNYEQDGEMASDLINLEQPFVITEAETDDGEALDTVTFRSRNQRTLETDIAALNEELKQLQEYQQEMQEKQKEAAGGGGGAGFFDNPASLLGLGAIGAFLAAIFLGDN